MFAPKRLLSAVLISVWIYDISGVLAQGAAESADPGQIRQRIDESRPKVPQTEPQPTNIPGLPETAVPGEVQDTFVLSAVVVEGSTVFEPGGLAQHYEDFLARSLTLVDVQEIAQRITQAYQDAGYVLSRAVVPPQQVRGGVLVVQVIEGYVGRVSFEGQSGQDALLAPYAKKMTAPRPARLADLEHTLLLINDLAGLSVRGSSLKKIDDDGAYEIIVSLGHDRFDGVAYADNRGTPAVGRYQAWLSAAANSFLGLGERLQVGFFTVPNEPQELLYGELSYHQPIGTQGTVVSATVSGSRVDAGGNLATVDSEGESTRISLRASHPVLLSRRERLTVHGTFDVLDNREDRLGLTNFDDSLRVFRAGLDYLRDDTWNGTTAVSAEISQGFDIAGASNEGAANLSRPDGESVFTKVTGRIERTQKIVGDLSVHVAAKGQLSADPLLSAEEFGLGGSQFGRAYDFSELTGEDGFATSVELRYGSSVNTDLIKAYQVYGFYDFGKVWNDNAVESSGQSLSSAGAGLRLTFARSVFASLELAKPLNRKVTTTEDKDLRVFFSLSAGF